MALNFRRRITMGASRLRTRFQSMDGLHKLGEAMSTSTKRVRGRNRVHSMDDLDCVYVESGVNDQRSRRIAWSDPEIKEDRYDSLATQWMRDWQVPPVVPFGKLEFKNRVESVRSAILAEMDRELARDMRTYNLAGRRQATCAETLSPQMEKAACTLGILGF